VTFINDCAVTTILTISLLRLRSVSLLINEYVSEWQKCEQKNRYIILLFDHEFASICNILTVILSVLVGKLQEWDHTNFLIDLAGHYANCDQTTGTLRVDRLTPGGERITGFVDSTDGSGTDINAVNGYIRSLVDQWADGRTYSNMVSRFVASNSVNDRLMKISKAPLATARAPLCVGSVIETFVCPCLSVCLSPKCVHEKAIFSKTKQFRAMVSIDYQQEVLHKLYKKKPIFGPYNSRWRTSGILEIGKSPIRHISTKNHPIF